MALARPPHLPSPGKLRQWGSERATTLLSPCRSQASWPVSFVFHDCRHRAREAQRRISASNRKSQCDKPFSISILQPPKKSQGSVKSAERMEQNSTCPCLPVRVWVCVSAEQSSRHTALHGKDRRRSIDPSSGAVGGVESSREGAGRGSSKVPTKALWRCVAKHPTFKGGAGEVRSRGRQSSDVGNARESSRDEEDGEENAPTIKGNVCTPESRRKHSKRDRSASSSETSTR